MAGKPDTQDGAKGKSRGDVYALITHRPAEHSRNVFSYVAGYDSTKAAASTWIFTIARNKRIDYVRKTRHPEPEGELDRAEDHAPRADETLNLTEEAAALAEAIKKLPPEQAELIQKAFFEEKSHSDIAAETNLPLGTVKSRIRLALDRMRSGLKGLAA